MPEILGLWRPRQGFASLGPPWATKQSISKIKEQTNTARHNGMCASPGYFGGWRWTISWVQNFKINLAHSAVPPRVSKEWLRQWWVLSWRHLWNHIESKNKRPSKGTCLPSPMSTLTRGAHVRETGEADSTGLIELWLLEACIFTLACNADTSNVNDSDNKYIIWKLSTGLERWFSC